MAKIGCGKLVSIFVGSGLIPRSVEKPCGEWYNGEQQLCDTCEQRAHRIYQQGWRYYPGDTCRHGVYVGGCGIDYMCGACEMGYE